MLSYHASAPDGNLVVEALLVRPSEIMPVSLLRGTSMVTLFICINGTAAV